MDMPLEELVSQTINNYRQRYLQFSPVDFTTFDLKGNPAYKIKYTFTDPNPQIGKIVATDFIFIRDNKEYRLTYFAELGKDLTYWPTIQKIVNSIPIGDSKNVSQKDEFGIRTGDFPTEIALNSITNDLYVANSGSNTVSVIDLSNHKVKNVIDVGTRPNGVAFNPDTNNLYVVNSGSNTVSVIDTSVNDVIDDIVVDSFPTDIGLDSGDSGKGSWFFVSNSGSNTVSVIDGPGLETESLILLSEIDHIV